MSLCDFEAWLICSGGSVARFARECHFGDALLKETLNRMRRNKLVRKQGGGLPKNVNNIEESIYMLLKFAYYEEIGSIMLVRLMILMRYDNQKRAY